MTFKKEISNSEEALNKGMQLFSANDLKLNEESKNLESMTPEQVGDFNIRVDAHNKARLELIKASENYVVRQAQLNKAIGSYYDMQSEQGSFGLLMKYGVAAGVTGPMSEVINYALQLKSNLLPIDVEKEMGAERYKNELIDAAKKTRFFYSFRRRFS